MCVHHVATRRYSSVLYEKGRWSENKRKETLLSVDYFATRRDDPSRESQCLYQGIDKRETMWMVLLSSFVVVVFLMVVIRRQLIDTMWFKASTREKESTKLCD